MRRYKGFFGRYARRRCPHSHLESIYGDRINMTSYSWRLWCCDCRQFIDGSVSLAISRRGESS